MQIVKFLIVNLLGFLSVSAAFFYASAQGMMPEIPDEMTGQFQSLFFGGTMLAWLVGGALSIAFFFMRGILKIVFLFFPLALPLIYAAVVLNLFHV